MLSSNSQATAVEQSGFCRSSLASSEATAAEIANSIHHNSYIRIAIFTDIFTPWEFVRSCRLSVHVHRHRQRTSTRTERKIMGCESAIKVTVICLNVRQHDCCRTRLFLKGVSYAWELTARRGGPSFCERGG